MNMLRPRNSAKAGQSPALALPVELSARKYERAVPAVLLILLILAANLWFWGIRDYSFPTASSSTAASSGRSEMSENLYFLIPNADNIVTNPENGIRYVNNEILLRAGREASKEDIQALADKYGGTVTGWLEASNQFQIQFQNTYKYDDLKYLIEKTAQDEAVEYAGFNLAFRLEPDSSDDVTNDSEWLGQWASVSGGSNWGIKAINAPKAWEYTNKMEIVNIGIYDLQFYTDHEDLQFASPPLMNDYDPNAISYDHGTHISGIAAAIFNNGKGIAGVSPKNMLFGVSNYGISSGLYGDYTTLMAAEYTLTYLITEKNCRAINISMGDKLLSFAASRGNENAINELNELNRELGNFLERLLNEGYDFVLCKTAGNQNADKFKYTADGNSPYGYNEDPNGKEYGSVSAEYDFLSGITNPAVKDRVIVVGSIQSDYEGKYSLSAFSQTGGRVDVLAPGVEIYSTIEENGGSSYDFRSGTSMSCPHVTGTAAMLFGLNPQLTGAQVKQVICETASGEYGSTLNGIHYAHGLLDAGGAAELALNMKDGHDISIQSEQ